jgi:protein ImuB
MRSFIFTAKVKSAVSRVVMFACIYVPDFPVEAIVRAEPSLRSRAVAVLEGKPPLTRVIALNERARGLGLEIGMTKLQAAAFAEKTESAETGEATDKRGGSELAVLRQRSPAQENSAHMALLDVAHAFTPRVEDSAVDTVLLDLAGFERMYGTAARMGSDLAARIAAIEIEANIAVAANPDAALHAARGFSGVTIFSAGKEAERLGELPIHVLLDAYEITSIGKLAGSAAQRELAVLRAQMLDTLERWGIRDFRALGQLPEHALSSRLGAAGVKLRRLALGQGSRTLVLCEPPSQFEEAMELEFPVETIESLSFVLNRLLDHLCARLEARALAVQEMRLRLQLERLIADEDSTAVQQMQAIGAASAGSRASMFERTIRLPVPMRDAKVFLKLLQLDLAANAPGAPVVKVWIAAEPTAPRSAQRGLFLPITPEAEKLEITLARINAVVGEHRAGIARLLDTHRPDGFQMERFVATNPSNREKERKQIEKHSALSVRRIRPPCRLRVQLSEGRPRALSPEIKQNARLELKGTVLWSAGPWRSSGEWWTESSNPDDRQSDVPGTWDREEWDVALLCSREGGSQGEENVSLFRIYRDIASDCWFADASYD